jgi:YfiH family protein
VCAVLTADCLPLLFCDRAGTRVAAVHAGWRGLAAGVIEAAVAALETSPADLLCWLGPAIGPDAFEVGSEVRDRFVDQDPACARAFRPSPAGKWLADLFALARRRLTSVGVEGIWGGYVCTYEDPGRFFSYRREGTTGRMASLVWIDPDS